MPGIDAVDEPILEPFLRRLRLRKVLPTIALYPDCALLDIGCGWEFRLLKEVEPHIKSGVGIDFKVREAEAGKIKTHNFMLDSKLPFPDESFDVVSMVAVLEHLANPVQMIMEIERVLKAGGRLVLTVPSKASKPVLELLAYRLKVINADEIRDHKKYYGKKELLDILKNTNLIVECHKYFQFGFNNLFVAKK